MKKSEDREKSKADKTTVEVVEIKEEEKSKATFEQRKDFARLEKEIKKLEEKKAEITSKFDDATLSPEKIMELSKELDIIQFQLEEKEEKWMELADLM